MSSEVNDLGFPLWPLTHDGNLVFNVTVKINDATKIDRGVMFDPIVGAITNALKPLFHEIPCVDLTCDGDN